MNQKTLIVILLVAVIILSGSTIYFATSNTSQLITPISNVEQRVTTTKPATERKVDKVQPVVAKQPKAEVPAAPINSNNLATYKNSTYGFEISLPASWKAYSESDGKVLASSALNFPQNPLILTGTPPTLDFQIEVVENNTIASYINSFLKTATKTGSKYIFNGKVFYFVQSGKNIIKLSSSNVGYELNDEIFNSLKLTK